MSGSGYDYAAGGGGVPPWDPLMGGHITPTMDEQEVQKLLSQNFQVLRAGKTPVDFGKVRASYQEFVDALADMEGVHRGMLGSMFDSSELDNQRFGDWIANPTSLITNDNRAFGRVNPERTGMHLRVVIALDGSESMTRADGVAADGDASRLGRRPLKGVPNAKGLANPILLAPRMFYASLLARYIYRSLVKAATEMLYPITVKGFIFALNTGGSSHGGGVAEYNGEVWLYHPSYGGSTPILPLMKRIQQVEIEDGSATDARLDLVVTDGEFTSYVEDDLDSIQFARVANGGSLRTVFFNITDENQMNAITRVPVFGSRHYAESPQMLAGLLDMVLREYFGALS